MILKRWQDLPTQFQNESIRPYYESLSKKKVQLMIKRCFDILMSVLLMILLSPIMLIIAILIKQQSNGPIFFKQIRITQYGRSFSVYKFRTMVTDAEKLGSQVTQDVDPRITKIGHKLRKTRLDELPQLWNIFKGEMSFVGTRPEVPRYVQHYTTEMLATLLLPAGVTSQASILYKDEAEQLKDVKNVDDVYIQKILPQKMQYNLAEILKFSLYRDIQTMWQTIIAVIK